MRTIVWEIAIAKEREVEIDNTQIFTERSEKECIYITELSCDIFGWINKDIIERERGRGSERVGKMTEKDIVYVPRELLKQIGTKRWKSK